MVDVLLSFLKVLLFSIYPHIITRIDIITIK